MHTHELQKIGKQRIPSFVGVYPLDKMPRVLSKCGANYIVNTHTHNLPGEHWLAVCYRKGEGIIHAFDPFGLFYPKLFKQSLLRYGLPVRYNRTKYQEIYERTCGHYCLSWLMIMNNENKKANCFTPH